MATVVSMTNPLTGAVEQVDKLDHTAQQIDDATAMALQLSNPNLLDNWYFANPVNQRGQSEYAVEGHTIDRWKSGAVSDVVGVVNGAITISMTDLYQIFSQSVESPELYAGKPVTASVLVGSIDANDSYQLVVRTGTASEQYMAIVINGSGLHSATWKIPEGATSLQVGIQSIKADAGSISVKAIKLELGSQQTLAHQDAGGNWVLNEIPDYSVELLKCQRYFYPSVGRFTTLYANTTTSAIFGINLPTAMRTTPSAELSELGAVTIGSTTRNVTNAIVKNVSGNLVCIQFDLDGTVSAQTAGYSFWTSVNLVADM